MTTIDTSDCWLEIGIGRTFRLSLIRHFVKFLHEVGGNPGVMVSLDFEARHMADRFIADMQEYFRNTLSDTYETLENLSPGGIVDLYIDENLMDFQHDYLSRRQAAVPAAAPFLAGVRPVPVSEAAPGAYLGH